MINLFRHKKKNLSTKPRIILLCYANFCRSPAAEYFLSKKFSNNIEVFSRGINPMPITGMDERTRSYLEKKGYEPGIHLPKKIKQNDIHATTRILALDFNCLNLLKKTVKAPDKSIKLLNFKFNSIILDDPYHMDKKEYNEIMNNIYNVCLNMEIEDLF